jgi:rhodanese-related sulfurtransferase
MKLNMFYALLALMTPLSSFAEVNISANLASVEVFHNGEAVVIQRNQNTDNTIVPEYAKTSRPCPPFCIAPGKLAPGVETITELEILDYLEKMTWGEPILVIDSRSKKWVDQGTIPGSINIPWSKLNLDGSANPIEARDILTKQFGVKIRDDDLFDFSAVKTLVLFCNGAWCGQSPANIQTLLSLGYPAHKLKWYRGGMQAWHQFGFTTVTNTP